MGQFQSRVSEVSMLRQAVLNTTSSIELLREAVSNSVDADAHNINIRLQNVGGDIWNVIIEDDGNGMEERHMKAFFNAGETEKDYPSRSGGFLAIGEKGLGSKTTFVAEQVLVESRRYLRPTSVLVGLMVRPMDSLNSGKMPDYTIEMDPAGHISPLVSKGTRITLSKVHIEKFNGKKTSDPAEIAYRVMHYLRSMCATGTVKNLHASKTHIAQTVFNVGVIPLVTVEVVNAHGSKNLGPESGSYPVPAAVTSPSGGPVNTYGVQENSRLFCDIHNFEGVKTLSVGGTTTTVHYDGTAVIAGESVRAAMLEHELKQGWTQKSQMGIHLCKDFIPLRNDTGLSRDLLGGEFYYEYKVFLNCQSFQLNSDRSAITNGDSDEIAWIWDDFKTSVWPNIEAKARPYTQMKKDEETATLALKKTAAAADLKSRYASLPPLPLSNPSQSVEFSKSPRKEADVSHLLAMMVQSGRWKTELEPIHKFGQYIDDSTDVLVEDGKGQPLLLEVELALPNLFGHKHPMASYDLVVVWSLGGMTKGQSRTAPWGTNGGTVSVALVDGAAPNEWFLQWGTHKKRVMVLENII